MEPKFPAKDSFNLGKVPQKSDIPKAKLEEDKSSKIFEKTKEVLKKEEKLVPLGPNRLVKGQPDTRIQDIHQEWLIHAGCIQEGLKNPKISTETKMQLNFLILNAYSLVSPLQEKTAQSYNIQTSPLLSHHDLTYYRDDENSLLKELEVAYAEELKLDPSELIFLYNSRFKEVLNRSFSQPDLDLEIDSEDKFRKLMEYLISAAIENELANEKPILIDITKYLKQGKLENDVKNTSEKFTKLFWQIAEKKVHEAMVQHNSEEKAPIQIHNRLEILKRRMHLIAYTQHQGQNLLLLPQFLIERHTIPTENYEILMGHTDKKEIIKKNTMEFNDRYANHEDFQSILNVILIKTGYLPSPDQARLAWLAIKDLDSILAALKLPLPELSVKGKNPKIFQNFKDFLNHPIVQEFRKLKENTYTENKQVFITPPYLKLITSGTMALLDGLREYDIDIVFKEKKLEHLLQIFYFRLLITINEATLRKNEIQFANYISIIHQIVQDFLMIVTPYSETALATSITENLTHGKTPVIPHALNHPQVHLMPSAMHCVTTIVSSVEALKGNNALNVLLLNDIYYELVEMEKKSPTHSIFSLDGDLFNKKGIQEAFDKKPQAPIDLFMCEFHHNMSVSRDTYLPENITEQVKALVDQKLVAEHFTVLIDTTIDLENSESIREFLNDKTIQDLILKGALNVVLVRSTQKFDMLGMDNYYGGIAISINDSKAFKVFNNRMNAPEDQLGGINYQGLAHLHVNARTIQDEYRSTIMNNTQKLYKLLPKKMIHHKQSQNPIKIAQIDDSFIPFIHIKFNKLSRSSASFRMLFLYLCEKSNLPLSNRPSFGFPYANVSRIDNDWRFTVSLESEEAITEYANIFQIIQDVVDKTTIFEDPKKMDACLTESLFNEYLLKTMLE